MRLILHDANQFKLKQDLLWVGVSTLATVVIWIIYAVYLAFTQTTVDPEVTKLLEPINPTLDETVLTRFQDTYTPPETFTILVKQEVNDTTVIIPLGSQIPEELLVVENTAGSETTTPDTGLTPPDSSTPTGTPNPNSPSNPEIPSLQ